MRLALGIEYDGSAYYGWQRQRKAISIQECLEHALSIIADETIIVYCAARTDSGVHAIGQVVHFDTQSYRSDVAWTLGINSKLPDDIAVRWVKPVKDNFHARFSAISRRYRYIIYNHPLRPALFFRGLFHYYHPLDISSMVRASQCLLGENDFTSFRSIQCQSRTPCRNLHHLHITRYGNYVIIDIKANAFVHHMVRNIVGSLLEVGCGNRPEHWIADLLACRDRTKAAAIAGAEGLYLVAVNYPPNFIFPPISSFNPLFFF